MTEGDLYYLIHVCFVSLSIYLAFLLLNQDPNFVMGNGLVLRFALQIALAMRFLHSIKPAIAHRDLKSPNCLVAIHFLLSFDHSSLLPSLSLLLSIQLITIIGYSQSRY
jgi:serine/threonine protein kinase